MFIDNYSATSSTLHKDNTVIFINQYNIDNIDPHQYETYVSNIYETYIFNVEHTTGSTTCNYNNVQDQLIGLHHER